MSKNLRAALAAKAEENTQRHAENTYADDFDVGRQHKMVKVDLIDRNPYQPRKVFDEDKIKSLAISISADGLLQPITVRAVGGRFELIAGERRLLAHKSLGRPNIESLVISADDATAATLALAENLKREDLTDYETAEAIRRVQDNFPKKSRLAESLDISRSELYRYIAYGKLPSFVRDRLEVRPSLLSRKYAEDIVKALKDSKDSDEALSRLQSAWSQLEVGTLEQSKIASFILAIPRSTDSSTHPRSKRTFITKAGERVGSFSFTEKEVVLKMSSLALNEQQLEALQRFVLNLVN